MEEIKETNVNILAKHLSEISKGAGKISFKIGYTATEGNQEIHKAFQNFCYEKANNEYLAGIGKLLEYSEIFSYLVNLDSRITELEKKANGEIIKQLTDNTGGKNTIEVNGEKTF